MRQFTVLMALLAAALLLGISSSGIVTADYPVLSDYITDEEGVVEYSEWYDDIYWVCEVLERGTSTVMAILVINSTGDEEIAMYATEVFNENGIGQEDKDNGVLIVVAVGDGTYFVAVGLGLEGVLNDAKVGRYGREQFEPYADIGDYGQGLYYLALWIGAEIEEHYEEAEEKDYPIDWIPLEWPQLLLAIAVTGIILVLTGGRLIIWIGPLLRNLGKGKAGGGGAGGVFRK